MQGFSFSSVVAWSSLSVDACDSFVIMLLPQCRDVRLIHIRNSLCPDARTEHVYESLLIYVLVVTAGEPKGYVTLIRKAKDCHVSKTTLIHGIPDFQLIGAEVMQPSLVHNDIGWDNGLAPTRRQTIISNNAEILIIGPLGTNFSRFLIEILFCHLPFRLGSILSCPIRQADVKKHELPWFLVCEGGDLPIILGVTKVTNENHNKSLHEWPKNRYSR